MKKTVSWILAVIGVLIGVVLITIVIGSLLPEEHVAARTLTLRQTPQNVWQAITDYAGQKEWRADLKSVERLPDQNGHEVWQEEYGSEMKIPLETVEAEAPRRLIRRIADEQLPFGGTWEYIITPTSEGGCQLTITERGRVSNPFFRFMSRFVFGYTATIESYLKALAGKFGETPVIR